ncbi:Pentatricopeptide repeat-containing protein, partial [Drosera capensis]
MRSLWIERINAGTRQHGVNYGNFIHAWATEGEHSVKQESPVGAVNARTTQFQGFGGRVSSRLPRRGRSWHIIIALRDALSIYMLHALRLYGYFSPSLSFRIRRQILPWASQSVLQGCNCGPNRSPRGIHSSHPSAMSMSSSSSSPLLILRPTSSSESYYSSTIMVHFNVPRPRRESVYGTLDAWVAWEQNFPIASLKNVLLFLEREQQWHRIIQVIKWMLSKGQGNTIRTYQQLIKALDMDHRAEEAHKVWVKKIGNDLHSVPWQFSHLMISVYYRNNMLENLVKLFKNLEAFDRRPPDKLIVQKVANAYELLGLMEDKERVLEKYSEPRNTAKKKSKKCKLIEDKQPDDMSQIASGEILNLKLTQ